MNLYPLNEFFKTTTNNDNSIKTSFGYSPNHNVSHVLNDANLPHEKSTKFINSNQANCVNTVPITSNLMNPKTKSRAFKK